MLPDRVSNPGPLTYESGALPIALRGPAENIISNFVTNEFITIPATHFSLLQQVNTNTKFNCMTISS